MKTNLKALTFWCLYGDSVVMEIENVNITTTIFEQYLIQLSEHQLKEYKLVIIDNAGFHSTKNINILENIKLIRISPCTTELNPFEHKYGLTLKKGSKTKQNFRRGKDIWLKEFVELNG